MKHRARASSSGCWPQRHGTSETRDVAARTGFADAASFGRAFERWLGCSPGAFRKRGTRA